MLGMMGKLKETQKKVEATKVRLNSVFIEEQSGDGLLKIILSANREIKAQLEVHLLLTLNKAIQKATSINEAELAAVAKEGMPNIPGLEGFLK